MVARGQWKQGLFGHVDEHASFELSQL